jgi:hypothetical protein
MTPCPCLLNHNYKTIDCDRCYTSYHIPCVHRKIVWNKQHLTSNYRSEHATDKIPPDYVLKPAYKCPNPKCQGYLMPMSKIKHDSMKQLKKYLFFDRDNLIWDKYQTRRTIMTIVCFIMFLLIYDPLLQTIDYHMKKTSCR